MNLNERQLQFIGATYVRLLELEKKYRPAGLLVSGSLDEYRRFSVCVYRVYGSNLERIWGRACGKYIIDEDGNLIEDAAKQLDEADEVCRNYGDSEVKILEEKIANLQSDLQKAKEKAKTATPAYYGN